MTIQTDITLADWRAFVRFVVQQSGQGFLGRIGRWLIALGIGATIGLGFHFAGHAIDAPNFGAGVLSMLLWIIISSRLRGRTMGPSPDGYILGPRSVTVSESGLRESSQKHETLFPWSAIRGVRDTGQHLFVMVDNNAAVLIPRRAFSGDTEREMFVSEVQRLSSVSANPAR